MRVGSLCINLLNALIGEAMELYSVSKIDLYTYGHQQGLIASYGVIYIGQKKNIWLWDFEKGEKVEQMNFEQLAQRCKER
ncbi:MAG: hypothetical protein LBG52_02440 [Candidatus Peribacteria bacterium]|nr:hypothetical protein [Candidatus Peribacteria bacterium]